MKNKALKNTISLYLMLVVLILAPFSSYARASENAVSEDSAQENIYGRLPVYLLDNGGSISYLEVYKCNENLYVKASSFARKMGYSIGYKTNGVQILQTENSSDREYRWLFLSEFENNSKSVCVFDGTDITNYTAPCATIKNDQGTWIPLQFAIKIMGREMVINSGVAVISEPHESISTIINNVSVLDLRLFPAIVEFNKEVEETYTNPILTQAVFAETSNSVWLARFLDKSVDEKSTLIEGVDELATYLVSNLGPENKAIYKTYFELMLMYMDQGYLQAADSLIDCGATIDSNFSADTSFDEGKEIIESSAASFIDSNSSTLEYNYAFDNTYRALTGYSPLKKEWVDEMVYADFLDTMITYKGAPDKGIITSMEFITSLLGPLSNYKSNISHLYVSARCARNELAENAYSRDIFKDYLSTNRAHSANSLLIKSISERVENYEAYQKKILDEHAKEVQSIDDEDIKEDLVDKGTKNRPAVSSLYEVVRLFHDYSNCLLTLDRIAQQKLMIDNRNFYLAKGLANELARYISDHRDADWAYIFYRSEYISNYYLSSALSNSKASNYISDESKSAIITLLNSVMNKDTYQLALLRAGSDYGLKLEDNVSYNEKYDDSAYIEVLENVDMSKGNSNSNINNCGFVTMSTNHKFYVDAENDYKAYMESPGKKGNKVEVSNGWAHWLNSFEDGDTEYLLYVNENLDLCSYNTISGETLILSEGDYSNAMVAYGYVFAKENGTLYRLELQKGTNVGEKIPIAENVGDCIAYDYDMILFSDEDGKVFKTNIDGLERTDLEINSDSFDIDNGNLYYSNNEDNRTIYVYNIMTGISTKLSTEENAYCLNVNNGLVYFKIDDGKSSSLVYSLVPFADKVIPRVYSWMGPDKDWSVSNEDDKVIS